MKHIILILLFFPLLVSSQILRDQENQKFVSQIHEEVHCFTDRDIYLSGEEIWFTTFLLLNNHLTDTLMSKVMVLELFDQDTKVIKRAKYPILSNVSSGTFQIPPEVLSGAYYLRAYTKFQRNSSSADFALVPLTIVNAELTLPTSQAKAGTLLDEEIPDNLLSIKLDKRSYSPREKVLLDIQVPRDMDGILCVSAVRSGALKPLAINEKENSGQDFQEDSLFRIPDIRGVSLSGFVRNKSTAVPVQDVDVFLSAFGQNNLLHIVKTQTNGAFLFSLDKIPGSANIFVTIDPTKYANVEVLINNDFSSEFLGLPSHPFSVDTSYKDVLTNMLLSYEIRKAYHTQYSPDLPDVPLRNVPDNFDFSVLLDDYIELSTLEEVFYEIIPPVSVKTNQSEKYLAVANYQTQRVSRASLILLDNVPVFDGNELLKISPANIQRIDVINRPYYLGDNILNSIVSLKTKTGDFGGYNFPAQSIFLEYQTLSFCEQFELPDYSKESELKSPLPDFRTTLYWNPAVEISGQDTSLSFYASDNKGKFDVFLRGVTSAGKEVFTKTSITIQ